MDSIGLGITVVTPPNRNRCGNIEATQGRIFVSEHKWRDGELIEEALMILSYADDSTVPVPAIFMFVRGMPVVI